MKGHQDRAARPTYTSLVETRIASARLLKAMSVLLVPMTPLAQALAQGLCAKPEAPWQCQKQDGRWLCEGDASAPSADALALDKSDVSTQIRAKSIESTDGKAYALQGEVVISQAGQSLRAPEVRFDREQQTAEAVGGTRLEDQGIIAYADRLKSDLATQSAELWDVRYALKSGQGNGKADRIEHLGKRSKLRKVTFTSCPGDEPAWKVRASRITLNQETEIGEAKDFKLYLGKVPVIYLPYASFPLTDKRKSGLLAPLISGSGDGVDISFPYYFNLAPNYDATLIPRFIQQRGLSLGSEFRHLGLQSDTNLQASYMPHDQKRDDERYSFNLAHSYRFTPNWRLGANLNTVSDDYYFEDLGDSLTISSTSVIGSDLGIYGRGAHWDAGLMTDRYEIIDPANPDSIDPYRRAPRLFYNTAFQRGGLRVGVQSELAQFRRDLDPEGSRIDITPFARYEWSTAYAFLRPELRWRHTRYRLEDSPTTAAFDRDATRTQPIGSIDMGLYFDRDQAFGHDNYRQTLEPRLYYLYSPFRDQSDFPIFDTTELDFSFPQLFRTNRFSGPDRQADANQAALALTTRVIDTNKGVEKIRLSVGQIRYFDDSLVTLPGVAPFTSGSGVWVAEAAAEVGKNWNVSLAHQYDPEISRTRLSAFRVQRHFGDSGLVNFGYRYRSNRIEQIDISGLAPINERWSLIGRWNYSLPESRTLEALGGFQYESCCWRLRLLGRHYVRAGTLDGRNTLFVEIELKGLGVLGRKTDRVLERAIVGFSRLNFDQ